MTNATRYSVIRLILLILVCTLLISCGVSKNRSVTDNAAVIAYSLKWPVAKVVGSAPVGVVTVRMSVSGSDMATIINDFAASAGTGSIANVPVGTNRTITFQGLDANSTLVYQASVPGVDLVAGQTYNCGTVSMSAVIVNTVPTVPTDPSGLSATSSSSSQINLTWIDNSNNETVFKIERKTGAGGTYAQIATTTANAISYNDSGLTASTTYYYRILASNSTGDSGYTNESNANTSPVAPTVPAVPFGLSATAASTSQINLAWADNSTDETGFKIERKTGSGGVYTQIAAAAANAVSYNDTGLTSGTTYHYRIRATNSVGDSVYTTEVNAATPVIVPTVPAAPSGLSATVTSASQINLSWADNSTDETGFKIERKYGSGGTYAQIGTAAANSISYNDIGLISGSTYFYRIRATNGAGDSGYTTEVNATTSGVAPRFFDQGNGVMLDTVTGLQWLKNANCFGQQSWTTASSQASSLANGQCGLRDGSKGGDYRLPSISELQSLSDYKAADLNLLGFSNVSLTNYWSSTEDGTARALGKSTNSIDIYTYSKATGSLIVWPVR